MCYDAAMKPALARAFGVVFLLVFGFLFAAPSFAQNTKSYNLAAIQFTGLQRYTQAQGVAASGLHIGKPTSVGDLQDAAERMSKAGAFDSVSFQYTSRGNDLTAVFGVTETKDVLPCIFDNFVWFSADDLDQLLRKHVNFYTGQSPIRGETQQQIQSTLTDYLVANKIPATVSVVPSSTSLLFHADGVSVPVKSISYPGRAQVPQSELDIAAAPLIDQEYSAASIAVFAGAGLGTVYGRHGYLRPKFGTASVALVDPASKGAVTPVAVTIPVTEGDVYHWGHAAWTGNQAIDSAALDKLLNMQPGEIVNIDKIESGLLAVSKAYKDKGYIAVQIHRSHTLDDSAKLATYAIRIDESNQYRMGQVFFEGVSPEIAAELAKVWTAKRGDIYDAAYASKFIQTSAAPVFIAHGIKEVHANLSPVPDPSMSLINVHIKFQ